MKKLLLLFSFLSCIATFAQDECASAITLTPSTVCQPTSGSLLNATTSTTTTGCTGYFDVFYKFVATSTAVNITATPASGSTLDLKISAFATCGTTTTLDCQDRTATAGIEYLSLSALTVGNTYYVKLANYSSPVPTNSNFTICVVNVTRPVNDECVGALAISPSTTCVNTSGSFLNATRSNVTSSCYGEFDVFYKFVATSTSTAIIATPATGTNIILSLHAACGSSAIACNDFAGTGIAETMGLDNLTIGVTYYVKVATSSSTAPVNPVFTICVQNKTAPTAPVNNECASAALLTQSTTCSATSGTLLGATKSTAPSSCSAEKDVFYKFVATATSADIKVTSSSGLNTTVSLFSSCGATTSILCVNEEGDGETEFISLGDLLTGSTYYIKVASSDFAPAANDFTICVQSVARPVNDDCSGAISLTPSSTCVITSGSLLKASTSNVNKASCASTTNSDVFYKFVAASAATSIKVTPSSDIDLVVSAFTACGGTDITCMDNSNTGGAETVMLNNLVLGSTYYIKIEQYGSTIPSTFTFDICLQNQVSTTPANDECIGAILLNTATSCSPVAGSLLNATKSAITSTSCRSTTSSDVFYKFVATSSAATITATSGTGIDLVLTSYNTCGSTFTSCADEGNDSDTEVLSLTGLTIGSTYYIRVAHFGTTAPTSNAFTICVAATSTPINDECTGAILLSTVTTCSPVAGSLLNATKSAITTTSCRSTTSLDVFYKFVANSPTATITGTSGAGIDLVLSSYNACGATYTSCIDGANDGGTEVLSLTGLTSGNTYYIRVAHFGTTAPTSNEFTICVVSNPVTAPANDECANAITLTQSSSCINTTGTFNNATNSAVTNSCTGYYDVFYKFVATSTTASVSSVPGIGTDVVLSVMTSCSSTTSLACVDDPLEPTTTEVANLTGLTVGTTYYIRVANYSTTLPTTSAFTICVKNGITTATQSSTALNAISLYPNPTQNVLNVTNITTGTKVELIDLAGKTLMNETISDDAQLDLANYSAGVYILKLTIDGVTENRRVVLSK